MHMILVEIAEERDTNVIISKENESLKEVLQKARQQYGGLVNRSVDLERQVFVFYCFGAIIYFFFNQVE